MSSQRGGAEDRVTESRAAWNWTRASCLGDAIGPSALLRLGERRSPSGAGCEANPPARSSGRAKYKGLEQPGLEGGKGAERTFHRLLPRDAAPCSYPGAFPGSLALRELAGGVSHWSRAAAAAPSARSLGRRHGSYPPRRSGRPAVLRP